MSGSSPTSKKETQIEAQCSYLDVQISSIGEDLELLEGRLSEILRAATPTESEGEDAQMLVGHADRIRSFGDRAKNMHHTLQDMMGRLEV